MKRKPPLLDKPLLRRRTLLPHEAELWRQVMEGTLPHPPVEQAVARVIARAKEEKAPAQKPKPQFHPHALDKATRQRVKSGKTGIDARLDLHGMTVENAHRALIRFVAMQQGEMARMLLVITGKGRAPQSGTLRQQLPRWLEVPPLSEQVVAFSPADQVHGGEGAWYLRLRKQEKHRT